MEPVHTIEYEMTSELAADVQRKVLRWALWRSWRRDLPLYVGILLTDALIIGFGLEGWILPGVGGGLILLFSLFGIGAFTRSYARARTAVAMALLARHASDRRVRIEFDAAHVRLETELFRGQGTWEELDLIVHFDGFWLLQLSNGGNLVVPAALLSPELQGWLRAKANQVMSPILPGD
jgi:hypothetical protein